MEELYRSQRHFGGKGGIRVRITGTVPVGVVGERRIAPTRNRSRTTWLDCLGGDATTSAERSGG
jgi:hypothetical protein